MLDANSTFASLAGSTRENLVGRCFTEIFFFLDPGSWKTLSQNLLTSNNFIPPFKARLMRADGCLTSTTISIHRLQTKKDAFLLATIHEISDVSLACEADTVPTNFQAVTGPSRTLDPMLEDLTAEELRSVIESPALQEMMDKFYQITHIGIGIIDLTGNILVATGWQEICMRFHRVHPECRANCLESDTYLSANVREGQYTTYKCKNNMLDLATPIIVGGVHIANLFLGQFIFDDEIPDEQIFIDQADRYGFDREEYLRALRNIPRWSRQTVTHVMEFYTRLAHLIAKSRTTRVAGGLMKALIRG
ncbi:MAG: PocR ligand-binding domain-containing protein, partial [Magnetococcales bacterium]|nr:PocR ligand-binding domain-containing protein [Magnetococcales bacterium]